MNTPIDKTQAAGTADEMQAAAMAWQRMVAGGPMEAGVTAASPRELIELRGFLSTQQPHGLISLGLGMVENEMIERFTEANS